MQREWRSHPFFLNEDGVEALSILKSIQPQLMAWFVVANGQEIPLKQVKPETLLSSVQVICRLPEGMHWEKKDSNPFIVIDDSSLVLFMSLIFDAQQQAFTKLDSNIVSTLKK